MPIDFVATTYQLYIKIVGGALRTENAGLPPGECIFDKAYCPSASGEYCVYKRMVQDVRRQTITSGRSLYDYYDVNDTLNIGKIIVSRRQLGQVLREREGF